MSNETIISVRGYAGASPLIFDNGDRGKVAQLSVGVTPRSYSRELGDFKDGPTLWYTVRCYGRLGQNVAESVRKGDPLLVRGRLTDSAWTDRDGNERSRLTINADALGIELTTGVARFQRTVEGATGAGAANNGGSPGDGSTSAEGGTPAEGGSEEPVAGHAAAPNPHDDPVPEFHTEGAPF